MVSRIFKYKLDVGWRQRVSMPSGALILTCAAQQNSVCIWALVRPDAVPEERVFHIYGTGNLVTDTERLSFVGTALLDDAKLVLHVFEEVLNG